MNTHSFKFIIACMLTLVVATIALSGCKDNKAENLNRNIARPTWTAVDDYDYTSSMTAIIRVNLKEQYPVGAADFTLEENDLLAAFMGETCVGTATLQDGLFFLFITGPSSQSEKANVTLRYYSAKYSNIFVATDAFDFVNDDSKGTVNAPLEPVFRVEE